jgi:hypothetical protein
LLGAVDAAALDTIEPAVDTGIRPAPAASGDPAPESETNGSDPEDNLLAFYNSFPPNGDRQVDAALLFAYYLQTKEAKSALGVGDLIRCCIRAGVDTRNFNRALGTLTRRGFLESVRPGNAYQLSEQGIAAVESRM